MKAGLIFLAVVLLATGLVLAQEAKVFKIPSTWPQPKDKYLLKEVQEKRKPVTLDHKLHGKTVECAKCHHTTEKPHCFDCHKKVTEGKKINLKDSYHKQCVGCHIKKMKANPAKKLPLKCVQCHK